MNKKQDSEIVRRKPFDLQGAVILLDAYLSFYKTGMSITESAEVASQRLRALAFKRGMVIDDSFRSAMGIQGRLCSIGNIFEGKESTSAPGTQVFREAVDLYHNDNGRYIELLQGNASNADAPKRKKQRDPIKKTKFVCAKKRSRSEEDLRRCI